MRLAKHGRRLDFEPYQSDMGGFDYLKGKHTAERAFPFAWRKPAPVDFLLNNPAAKSHLPSASEIIARTQKRSKKTHQTNKRPISAFTDKRKAGPLTRRSQPEQCCGAIL